MSKLKYIILLISFCLLLFASGSSSAQIIIPNKSYYEIVNPKIQGVLNRLINEYSKGGSEAAKLLADRALLPVRDDKVKVVLVAEADKSIDLNALEALEVRIVSSYRHLLQVEVPIDKIKSIAEEVSGVSRIRLPYKANPLEVSEGVLLSGASDFLNLGVTGVGVKIAVIDTGFGGWDDARTNGDLPFGVIISTFDDKGYSVNISSHGTACAEVIYDMAPGAELHLLRIDGGAAQLGIAKDYCKTNSIDIISCSLGWFNTGPGDGTGDICDIANDARNSGILWVNSAGNQARRHWRGTYALGLPGILTRGPTEFWDIAAVNPEITVAAGELLHVELRWNSTSWNYCDQDYDLFLFDGGILGDSSIKQTGNGFSPSESLSYVAAAPGVYTVLICNYMGRADPLEMELFSINHDLDSIPLQISAGSLAEPADSAEVLAVGAIDYSNWVSSNSIANFSSQGPTNDGRIKPDLCGPDRVTGYTYGIDGFTGSLGTSASCPHVAGAAALILSMFPDYDANDIEGKLFIDAIDCGAAGKDNVFGYGKLNVVPLDLPHNLRCEGALNPVDITDYNPEFSWAFSSQSAYQLLVSSSSGMLAIDTGDLWDSTKVVSGTDTVQYAGVALSGNCTYYWKLRCWDIDGDTSTYSMPQTFSIINSTPYAPSGTTTHFLVEIDLDTLEFSWTFSDLDYVDIQTSYQVIVSSFIAEIDTDTGGFWDSSKVISPSSVAAYAGTSLEYGTDYYWKVRTWDVKGVTGPYCSRQMFATTDRPTNFVGVALSTYSIKWSWQDNCKVVGCSYVVYDDSLTTQSGSLSQDTTFWIETGLVSNSSYTRRVELEALIERKFSNTDTRYTLAELPAGLTALPEDIGDHSVELQWTAERGSRFGVARATVQAAGMYVWLSTGTLPGTGMYTNYTDNNSVFAKTTYWYMIKGYNGDGIETSTTTAIRIVTRNDIIRPEPPIIEINLPAGQEGIGKNDTITISGMSIDSEPELTIDNVRILDQTGYVLYMRGDGVSLFDENVDINYETGVISGTIKLMGSVKDKHRIATHLQLEVTVRDYNDDSNNFTREGLSILISVMGERLELNVYIPYAKDKVAFNPMAEEEITIRFEVVELSPVEVGIYNIAGELVESIASSDDGEYAPGIYLRTWDGKSGYSGGKVASGIYLIYCNVGGNRIVRKVALVNE